MGKGRSGLERGKPRLRAVDPVGHRRLCGVRHHRQFVERLGNATVVEGELGARQDRIRVVALLRFQRPGSKLGAKERLAPTDLARLDHRAQAQVKRLSRHVGEAFLKAAQRGHAVASDCGQCVRCFGPRRGRQVEKRVLERLTGVQCSHDPGQGGAPGGRLRGLRRAGLKLFRVGLFGAQLFKFGLKHRPDARQLPFVGGSRGFRRFRTVALRHLFKRGDTRFVSADGGRQILDPVLGRDDVRAQRAAQIFDRCVALKGADRHGLFVDGALKRRDLLRLRVQRLLHRVRAGVRPERPTAGDERLRRREPDCTREQPADDHAPERERRAAAPRFFTHHGRDARRGVRFLRRRLFVGIGLAIVTRPVLIGQDGDFWLVLRRDFFDDDRVFHGILSNLGRVGFARFGRFVGFRGFRHACTFRILTHCRTSRTSVQT